MDWTQILVAAVGATALVASSSIPVYLQAHKTRRELGRRVGQIHDEVKTNHGKSAGEYLEMIGQIAETQEALFWLLAELDARDHRQYEKTMEHLKLIDARNTLRDAEHEAWRLYLDARDRETDK